MPIKTILLLSCLTIFACHKQQKQNNPELLIKATKIIDLLKMDYLDSAKKEMQSAKFNLDEIKSDDTLYQEVLHAQALYFIKNKNFTYALNMINYFNKIDSRKKLKNKTATILYYELLTKKQLSINVNNVLKEFESALVHDSEMVYKLYNYHGSMLRDTSPFIALKYFKSAKTKAAKSFGVFSVDYLAPAFNEAAVQTQVGNYNEAQKNFEYILSISKKIQKHDAICNSYIHLGRISLNFKNNYFQFNKYMDSALKVGFKYNYYELITDIYKYKILNSNNFDSSKIFMVEYDKLFKKVFERDIERQKFNSQIFETLNAKELKNERVISQIGIERDLLIYFITISIILVLSFYLMRMAKKHKAQQIKTKLKDIELLDVKDRLIEHDKLIKLLKENTRIYKDFILNEKNIDVYISEILHDEVAGKLAYLSLVLSKYESKDVDLKNLKTETDNIYKRIRELSHSLKNPTLENHNIPIFIQNLNQAGSFIQEKIIRIEIEQSSLDTVNSFANYIKGEFSKTILELFNNAMKHSINTVIEICIDNQWLIIKCNSIEQNKDKIVPSNFGIGLQLIKLRSSNFLGYFEYDEKFNSISIKWDVAALKLFN